MNCWFLSHDLDLNNPANTYFFKINNRNIRKRCGICSTLTIKTPEQRNVIDAVLVFLLLTFYLFNTFPGVSTVDFDQVNVCWVVLTEFQDHGKVKNTLQHPLNEIYM